MFDCRQQAKPNFWGRRKFHALEESKRSEMTTPWWEGGEGSDKLCALNSSGMTKESGWKAQGKIILMRFCHPRVMKNDDEELQSEFSTEQKVHIRA